MRWQLQWDQRFVFAITFVFLGLICASHLHVNMPRFAVVRVGTTVHHVVIRNDLIWAFKNTQNSENMSTFQELFDEILVHIFPLERVFTPEKSE